MSSDSHYLESVLHQDIPLTRDMGLKVLDWQQQRLRLQLPLDANVNHKSTMFGGSLYCGAGWRAGAGCTCACARRESMTGISSSRKAGSAIHCR